MNRWHALAAILALMTVRGASHRIAALHGELGCGHTHAIERIARQNSGEYRDKHPACKAHDNQSRGATGRVSRSRTARDGCERDETGACKTIRTPASSYHRKEENPSPGRRSTRAMLPFMRCKIQTMPTRGRCHISPVSTYRRQQTEQLRSHRASSRQLFYPFHRKELQVAEGTMTEERDDVDRAKRTA